MFKGRKFLTCLIAIMGLVVFASCGSSGGGSNPIAVGQTTFTISGTVSGDIQLGVTITLSGASSGTTTTDVSGNYSFSGLANGVYSLTPSLADFVFSPVSSAVPIIDADSTGNDFVATQVAFTISGTVTGDVLQGVTITLSGDSSGSNTTDGSGNYSFSGLADGSYTVTPSLSGYTFGPASTGVTLSGADSIGNDFVATAVTYTISGTVTGDIQPGVTITLSGAASASTVTDVSGDYSFTGLVNGTYTLTPSLATYTFNPVSSVVTISGADLTGNNFTSASTVAPTFTISGTVTGAIVQGVTIDLSGAANGAALTDASGNYSISGLVDGSYTLTPSLSGYTFSPTNIPAVPLSGADSTGNDFVATAVTYSISGTVTGDISAGVTITLGGASSGSTVTDVSGSYSFSGLTNGSYTLAASLAGYSFDPVSSVVTISGADSTGNDFVATAVTFTISGTVSGDILPGVTITLTGATNGATVTDGSGNYSFTGLPNGGYTLTPSLSEYTFSPVSTGVTLSGADSTGNDFDATAVTYSISGTVSGDVLPGVTITLAGDANDSAVTDGSGDYSFTGLANGSYTLTPSLAGYTFSPVSNAVTLSGADSTGNDFTSSLVTYSISGTVSGAISAGVTITLTGDANDSAVTDGSGDYSFTGLADGSYTLTPSLSGYTFSPVNTGLTISGADATGNNFTSTFTPLTFSISGTVTGDVLEDVTIDLSGAASASTVTDVSGSYSFSGLTNGSYTLAPSLAGYTFSPVSSVVTISGADSTGNNFTSTIASSTYDISGTITGPYVVGITVTLSGDSPGTTTTDAGGNYSFAGLPDGGSYTLTPSLAGYDYTPINIPRTLSGMNSTGNDFVATSTMIGYTVSGTVSYSGLETGRIYLSINWTGGGNSMWGTSIASAGTFTIRGVSPGTFTVSARLNHLGPGANSMDPVGQSTPFTVSVSDVTGIDVTLIAPSIAPTPEIPTFDGIFPSNETTLIFWEGPRDMNDVEIADSYQLSWGTNVLATNGAGSPITFAANGDWYDYFHTGLTNGITYYYKVRALVGGVPSSYSPIESVLVEPPTGLNTVSGTVTYSGVATGPLYVGVFSDALGLSLTKISSPTSGVFYSVSGVANGNWEPFGIIDNNNNGLIDSGDIQSIDNPFITVSGDTTADINLDAGLNILEFTTEHVYDGSIDTYAINLDLEGEQTDIVKLEILYGPNAVVPADIARGPWGYWANIDLGTKRPNIGDTYGLKVTYSDLTSETITVSVTNVLDAYPESVTVTPVPSATIPTINWTAPNPLPAFMYSYSVSVWGMDNWWWYPEDGNLPDSQFSVLFDIDGGAWSPALTLGNTYTVRVTVEDQDGNEAIRHINYTP